MDTCKSARLVVCLLLAQQPPHQWARASSFTRFLDHTRHSAVGRTHWTSDQCQERCMPIYKAKHATFSEISVTFVLNETCCATKSNLRLEFMI